MKAGMMKLIIPDYGSSDLKRIDSMNPGTANWYELVSIKNPSTGGPSNFYYPYDITFDASGRVFFPWFTNGYIIRLNDLTPSSQFNYVSGHGSNLRSITIDEEVNDVIYSTNGSTIRSNPISGGASSLVFKPAIINTITAIEYTGNFLYICGTNTTGNPSIFRYPIGNPGGTISATSTSLRNPQDILIKHNKIYIANPPINYSTDNWASIEVFDQNTLAFIGSYGSKTTNENDSREGYFYGPYHFIAPTNRKIYIIDDSDNNISETTRKNRIVAFDDVGTWEDWETFAAEDVGQNPFRFYNYSFC